MSTPNAAPSPRRRSSMPVKHAFVFADNVSRAAIDQRIEVRTGSFQLRPRPHRVGWHVHGAGGGEALVTALVVFSADELVFDPAMKH